MKRHAFTLVELLVVIGIITVLIGILMPVLSKAREQAQTTACMSNLKHVGAAMEMYSNDFKKFPDGITSGNFAFRMKPGLKTANDPGALPETYGIAAVLHGIQPQQDLSGGLPKPKYIAGDSKVWVCPAQPDWMLDFGNTYAFALRSDLTSSYRTKHPDTLVVWDNFSLRPGLSGFRGPFSGYTVPSAQQKFTHRSPSGKQKAAVTLYSGGHVALRALD
jgi:prepilin-type N-terminal cleavage/methylation domain-containing protein